MHRASTGADVILLARDVDSGFDVFEEIRKLGRAAHMYQCDLSDRETLFLKIVPLITEHGDEIDIFIHCAGVQFRCPAEDFRMRIGTR
jgi:short-subunit dehydrogenase